ncbi:hypothetical protein KAZ66_00970 [Candidatus Woesebacteria bacterium]|nr:hypothetical protein [Candidatus Woesebacteria bacterium]
MDSEQVTQFFYGHLKNEVVSRRISQAEVLYAASVLAEFAHSSCAGNDHAAPSRSLYEILDKFVLPVLTVDGATQLQQPEVLEVAGKQTLFLVGFFRDQMRAKHNLEWYDHLGSAFFSKAGELTKERNKSELLRRIGGCFTPLAMSCYRLNRKLQEESYLLRLD